MLPSPLVHKKPQMFTSQRFLMKFRIYGAVPEFDCFKQEPEVQPNLLLYAMGLIDK